MVAQMLGVTNHFLIDLLHEMELMPDMMKEVESLIRPTQDKGII